jgi:hypothetical protein
VFTADNCVHAFCRFWTSVTDNVSDDAVHHVKSVQFHASPYFISQWLFINVV